MKKPKQKKIPQRGLGVAQLEKLRLEEQQKNAASSSSDPSQHPYVPLLSNEGVMRPRVLLKASVPVAATTADLVGSAQPPPASESSAKHAVLPLLWNAVDPHPTDGHAVATRFGFHVSCRKQQSPVTLVRRIDLHYPPHICMDLNRAPRLSYSAGEHGVVACVFWS